jgi:DNA-binding XRE family transcriptional regulator
MTATLEKSDKVTLSKAEYEALLDRIEDLEDTLAIERSRAEQARLGRDEYIRLSYTAAEVERSLAGATKLSIWRARSKLTQAQLAERAGVTQSLVAEIERGKKAGSAATLAKLAAVLDVPVGHLIERAPRS